MRLENVSHLLTFWNIIALTNSVVHAAYVLRSRPLATGPTRKRQFSWQLQDHWQGSTLQLAHKANAAIGVSFPF